MKKCSYPECGYIASHEILNRHAKTHGFNTTKEMEKVYGKCELLQASSEVMTWARETTSGPEYNSPSVVRRKSNRSSSII